jgi:hypothetical protein
LTVAKEKLARPTTMDAMDGRSGLGRQRLLRVARREGGRGMGDWNLGDGCCLQVARREGEGVLELLGFSFRVRKKERFI